MEMVKAVNLKKYYITDTYEVHALDGVSLSAQDGEFLAIVGTSGSGKTTLLNLLGGLDVPTSGGVWIRGSSLKDMDKEERTIFRRRNIGFVFQNYNLFPHYSVLRNIIDAPVCVQKRRKSEAVAEAKALLRKIGLEGRENAYPYQLSGGQQQRVSIVRALAMNPEILFFDEPTSALDPELTGEILHVIRQLAEERMTMVIVTHEIHFARNVSDRIIFMADGLIVEEGPAKELIDHPRNERTRAFLAHTGNRF